MDVIYAPRHNPNDDIVHLVAWKKAPQDYVRVGDVLAELETSKAIFELHAEIEGFFSPLVEPSNDVAVGDPIAVLLATPGEEFELPDKPTTNQETVPPDEERRWTIKARLLAKRHMLDESTMAKEFSDVDGPVTEELVRRYLEQRATNDPSKPVPLSRDKRARARLEDDIVDGRYSPRTERILILGGANGAVQTLDVIGRCPTQRGVAILDDNDALHGKTIMGCPIVGPLSLAESLWSDSAFDKVIIAITSNIRVRSDLFTAVDSLGIPFTNVIDPSVMIHSNVSIGVGNLILAYCRLGPCAIVGDNNFLSAYVNVEHNNILGSHNTFGPGVFMSGTVQIGDRVRFGTGISIEPRVRVENDAIVASGTILTTGMNIPKGSTVKSRINQVVTPPSQSWTHQSTR